MDRAAIETLTPCRAPVAAALLLSFAALPGLAEETPAPAASAGPPAPAATEADAEAESSFQCLEPGSDGTALMDKMQRGVYRTVCGTALWFDGLFGTRRYDQDSDATFGRLGLSEFWSDRDGFDTRLRLRARIALPTMEKRLRLLFGRVDENEVIEGSPNDTGGTLPSSFRQVEDDAWLLGLGYSKQNGLTNGFDFGAGIRITTPVDPYVKGSYRQNFIFSDATALRGRQTVFWRDSRGLGETTEIDLDHLITSKLLLRWENSGTLAEDVRRLEWTSALVAFQSIGRQRGIAYSTFIHGVVNTDVPVRNYGVELRYRRQMYREWLFLEARTNLTWPKDSVEEERKINPGVGLGFEMYFGPVPENQLR